MHTNHPREEPLVEMGYEIRDINYRGITRAVYIFFGFATFSFVVGLGLYNFWNPSSHRQTVENLSSRARPLPAKGMPLLQDNVDAKTDLKRLREEEDKRIEGTGYVDEAHSAVHIPVDRAMDLLAERGLPQTASEVPAISRGTEAIAPGSEAVLPAESHATPESHAPEAGH